MTLENTAVSPAEGNTHMASTVRAGSSGLVNAKRSVTSAGGSPIDRGPSTWSDIFSLRLRHGTSFHGSWSKLGPDRERSIDRCNYPTLSRNSSTALPTRSSRCASATDRFRLDTYQAAAVIWCLTSQSLIAG